MTTQKYPRGWNKARIQRVLEYYESQTDTEVAAEIEAGIITVEKDLFPSIQVGVECFGDSRLIIKSRGRRDHDIT